MPAPRLPVRRAALLVTVLGLACGGLTAADAVIMPDGYTIQGRAMKENNPTGYGFDVVEDGPKLVVFSSHAKKGAKIEKGILRREFTAYKRPFPGTAGLKPPPFGEMSSGEFDEKWVRFAKIKPPTGGAPSEVRQLITFLDPYQCNVSSTTHAWRVAFHTAEMEPKEVRRLLASHPDLKDPAGKPDPLRRLAIVTFLADVGWLDAARTELAQAHKDVPGEWPKDAADREAEVRTALDLAETRMVLDELDAALASGRYDAARRLVTGFEPKAAEQADTTRLAVLKAQIETVAPRYEEAARLLAGVIDRASGASVSNAAAAVVGSPVLPVAARPAPDAEVAPLLPAASAVLAELHPDTVGRVELFANLARQADAREREGKDPGAKPSQLLSLAVTGWLKGKNGADPSPANALRCWATRETALGYLRSPILDERLRVLDGYLQGNPLTPDELTQVVSLLPPPFAADPAVPPGPEMPKADALVRGVYKVTVPGPPAVSYFLKLPPEYHHGRAYPVLLGLSHPSVPGEKLAGMLSGYADRHGYIVAVLDWGNRFAGHYDWDGDEHPLVTGVLRDLLRRYQADPDKVFLFGLGEGATFALDVGASHPDLFAGMVLFGPVPNRPIMMHYWQNLQKLPMYVVSGEMAGDSTPRMRTVFEKLMPRGYPAMLTMYRGRGVEWYGMELPRIFDWMGRKARARGTASLRLNAPVVETWALGRNEDNRFYWIGTNALQPAYLMRGKLSSGWVPASLYADIRQGNEIVVKTLGVKDVVIWLERELIDWTRPVRVSVNGQTPHRYVAKVIPPDLRLMFEELYRTGDRKMLYLGRLEFATP